MTKDAVNLFFALLRFEINNTELCSRSKEMIRPENLTALYKLFKRHDLSHLMCDALDKNGCLENNHSQGKKKLFEERKLAIIRAEKMQYEFERICNCLENEKIYFIPLKGAVVRNFYSEQWMRTSCDIDIFIKNEDVDKAEQVLTEQLKFRQGGTWINEKSLFSESNIHLELHYVEDQTESTEMHVLNSIWGHCRPAENSTYHLFMEWEYFYLYHIAHMAKHFTSGGCGVRSFIDLQVMNNNLSIDNNKLENLLKKYGYYEFYNACLKLAKVWFSDEEHDRLTKNMQDYILGAGIYGNKENWATAQQIKRGEGKIKHVFRRLFPPYEHMVLIYPKLQGKKWLLPFYQIRKWFRLFKPKTLKSSLAEVKQNSKEKQSLEKMFKQLNIDSNRKRQASE